MKNTVERFCSAVFAYIMTSKNIMLAKGKKCAMLSIYRKRGEMSYCAWSRGNALLETYHDTEGGVPEKDDLEYLIPGTMQRGLSWMLMLKKYDSIRCT